MMKSTWIKNKNDSPVRFVDHGVGQGLLIEQRLGEVDEDLKEPGSVDDVALVEPDRSPALFEEWAIETGQG